MQQCPLDHAGMWIVAFLLRFHPVVYLGAAWSSAERAESALDLSAYTLYDTGGRRLVATERGVMHVARRARRADLDPGGTIWQQTPR